MSFEGDLTSKWCVLCEGGELFSETSLGLTSTQSSFPPARSSPLSVPHLSLIECNYMFCCLWRVENLPWLGLHRIARLLSVPRSFRLRLQVLPFIALRLFSIFLTFRNTLLIYDLIFVGDRLEAALELRIRLRIGKIVSTTKCSPPLRFYALFLSSLALLWLKYGYYTIFF